jgi:hypothetical protein
MKASKSGFKIVKPSQSRTAYTTLPTRIMRDLHKLSVKPSNLPSTTEPRLLTAAGIPCKTATPNDLQQSEKPQPKRILPNLHALPLRKPFGEGIFHHETLTCSIFKLTFKN